MEAKLLKLNELLAPLVQEGFLVAFSGGVDSAFLLWSAAQVQKQSGGRVVAVTAVSASMAQTERDDSRRFTQEFGIEHFWEESSELENPAYLKNDGSRCYHCKSELFHISERVLEKHNLKWLAYGYNTSDAGDFRPGHKAALERGVLFPLFEAGFSKTDIRNVLRKNKIFLSEKPASPCLSSRIMNGIPITPQKLAAVESMEKGLRDLGFSTFRVRYHEHQGAALARIETSKAERELLIKYFEEIGKLGKNAGFQWVTIDVLGYKMGGGNFLSDTQTTQGIASPSS